MPPPSHEPRGFAPADRFVQRRRIRARYLSHYFADTPVIVLASGQPTSAAGCLSAAGVDGLLRYTGLNVRQASLERIARNAAAGDLLVVPPPTALGFDEPEEAAMAMALAPRSFTRVLLVGWSCPLPTTHLSELLSHGGVMATVPDAATYASLKAHGRVELDVDPAIYLPAFGSSLSNPSWEQAFDGAARSDQRGTRSLTLLGDTPWSSSPCDDLDRLLADLAASDTVITDQWHVLLSSLLLGRHVDYIDTPSGPLRSRLMFHFGGEAGALATPRDAGWLARVHEPIAEDR